MNIKYSTLQNYDDIYSLQSFFHSELSENYSLFTYSIFYSNYSEHCFIAKDEEKIIGAILAKTENEISGYIGLLAVQNRYRRKKIGSQLLNLCINSFQTKTVVLETEIDNFLSLKLYERFGFIKVDYYTKYYLNGKDAYKLCLYRN